ncbi:hypothetical protein CPB83DRAFT_853227 [Crepidotus variabilis]|uniref:Uncharacterized protein n=1 Tax=Crepidotus variabilis TaxID=179855 RepID=A0A9P6EGF8_9AGAR|nr:hypothetical protein CPB83DRAFT_853227 [Crepidotus variabilis]
MIKAFEFVHDKVLASASREVIVCFHYKPEGFPRFAISTPGISDRITGGSSGRPIAIRFAFVSKTGVGCGERRTKLGFGMGALTATLIRRRSVENKAILENILIRSSRERRSLGDKRKEAWNCLFEWAKARNKYGLRVGFYTFSCSAMLRHRNYPQP